MLSWILIPLAAFLGFQAGRYRTHQLQNSGEMLVRRSIQQACTGPNWHLLNNVTLPTADGTTQIDHVLVSRYGVFVIETKDSVVAKNATTAADGKTYQVDYYNLDVILSVGYRVNSLQATRFRQWATRVLREHLVQGYSLNEHRLSRQGLADLEQAVALLGKTLVQQQLVNDIGREVVGIILQYAKTWRLLLDYDEDRLALPQRAQSAKGILEVAQARRALDALANELRRRNEASELFARDRGDGLAAILGNIEQTMFGEPLYKTREERAAHLL